MTSVWTTELSLGDVRNGNIRFASTTLPLSPDFFGGSNADEPAPRLLNVQFGSSPPTKQWLYGDKKIFANRNPATKDFFAAIAARDGTKIKVSMLSPDFLKIEKA